LLEETGYQAASLECLTEGPSSAGISTEVISFFRARGLKKISKGGGDQSEDITVHVIPLDGLMTWLDSKRREGCLVDYKIFAGLFFEFSRDGIG
jgi:ADP-ribose pyrophosphatase